MMQTMDLEIRESVVRIARYGEYDKMQGYVCCNDSSEYVADFVEYNFCCADYEEK
jgi:hypothetical protein